MESEEINESNENGEFFLKLLKTEKDRLEKLVIAAENELTRDTSLSEEVSGILRIAVGKARLLIRQKFEQFEGLCRKNLEKIPKDRFIVTSEDLAGYWEVLIIQIAQIHDIFNESKTSMKRHMRNHNAI